MSGVTIFDVMRDMGVEGDTRWNWSVGLQVVNRWNNLGYGEPEKRNRTKTCGKGVHCFAHYPLWFVPQIKEIILANAPKPSAQLTLFEAADEA